jgi:hypothetical protein
VATPRGQTYVKGTYNLQFFDSNLAVQLLRSRCLPEVVAHQSPQKRPTTGIYYRLDTTNNVIKLRTITISSPAFHENERQGAV